MLGAAVLGGTTVVPEVVHDEVGSSHSMTFSTTLTT